MRKNFLLVATCALFAASVMSACSDNSPYPGYKKTESGMYYRYFTQNEGRTANVGDVVEVNLSYFLMKADGDSLIYTTTTLPEAAFDMVREPTFPGDLYEGFAMMHKGDSMSMIMSADSVFLRQFRVPILPAFVTPGDMIRWEVKMNDLMTEEEFNAVQEAKEAAAFVEAQQVLDAFLAENGIEAEPTESGLIYICTQPGKGPQPQVGQNVKVHYSGKLLDGTGFDSSYERNEPISFPLGMGHVIPGWDEGIALMHKGEKGVLYIPAKLAYGGRNAGPIPPYSNLIFEVELVDIE